MPHIAVDLFDACLSDDSPVADIHSYAIIFRQERTYQTP